jgi:PKD repeat protein
MVRLDGSRSSGEDLSYQWSWVNRPQGSQAAFSDDTSVNPEFTADVAGTYTASLVVSSDDKTSDPAEVTITALAYRVALEDFVIFTQVEVNLDEIGVISGHVGSRSSAVPAVRSTATCSPKARSNATAPSPSRAM